MNIEVQEYKSWIEKFINRNDNREINYQNDVVKCLLERLFEEYDIIYVDTKGPDSKSHDYYAYSGKLVASKEYFEMYGSLIDEEEASL